MRFEKDYIEMIESFIAGLESGDPNLQGHSLYVRRISCLIYDFLPINYRFFLRKQDLELATLLMDVGRLGIPENIVNKQGKFSSEEREIMGRQPGIAADMLMSVKSFKKIAELIKYQHERVDGRGYYGLKGDQIPLGSRIMSVADTFSAITTNRTYKANYNYDEAVAELHIAAGYQLDREIVECFCQIPVSDIRNARKEVKEKIDYFRRLKSGEVMKEEEAT